MSFFSIEKLSEVIVIFFMTVYTQYLEQEASLARERQQEILRREEDAKKRVAHYTQTRREELQRREVSLSCLGKRFQH